MKTVRNVLHVCFACIAFVSYAEDLPSRFDWRNVKGKCYVTPVRGVDSGPDHSYAYAPMDCLEAVRLLFCEEKGWNELDDTAKNGMLFPVGDVASNVANAESRAGASSGFFNGAKYPCVTKSLDWLIRRPFGGRYVTNISFHDGIDPDYDPATGDENFSGYWEAAVERLKKNLRETPFMAGIQYVDEYVQSGKYSFFPPFPQTEFKRPEYYRTVLIVGWDDEVPANYFQAEGQCPEGPGAWIVKSSRGEGAGDGGYFYISFYDRSVLKMNEEWAFLLKDDLVVTVLDGMLDDGSQDFGAVYSYDLDSPSEFGMTYRDSYGVMFTAERDATINGIGIFDLTGRSYKIYARTGCQSGKPASGTLVLSGERVYNRMSEKGYNVYTLSEPFEVKKGQRFSIMVEGSGLAFMRKNDFTKNRYFHGSEVDGSEWYDIAATAEEEKVQYYNVPFITAYEKNEGVFLQASDGDFIDQDGTPRTEYGVEVRWETTVKSGNPVYDLYRAPEGSSAFKLVKAGLRERRYVDLLSTFGGELEIDRKYDYKVVDTVHDIESNVNSGFVGTLPRLLDVEVARLWLVGEGPYNVRLTWNAYNPVYTVSADWNLLKKRGGDLEMNYKGTSSDVGNPGGKKVVDVSQAIPLIAPKGHGVYDMNVQWTAHNKKSGNSKKVNPNGKRCDVNVYFNKYKREAGKHDISNWFRFWPEDGAIDSRYFKQEVHVEGSPNQFDEAFYFNGSATDRGMTVARLFDGVKVFEDGDFRVWRARPVVHYYLSDNGAAIGDKLTKSAFPGYDGPDVGENSIGLQKVADTIEHEMKHGSLWKELFEDAYFRAYEQRIDWTKWSRDNAPQYYSAIAKYLGHWVEDRDGDGLSDVYETEISRELGVSLYPTNPDSLGIKAYSGAYVGCGDNEYLARLEESKTIVKIFPNNDWAFPGSQIAQYYQGHQNTPCSVKKTDPETGSDYLYYPYWGWEEDKVKEILWITYPSDTAEPSSDTNASAASSLGSAKNVLEASGDELVKRDSGVLKEYYPEVPSHIIADALEILSVGEGTGIDSDGWYYSSLVFPVAVTNVSDEAQSCIMRGYILDSDERAVAWATVDITVPANSKIEENLVFNGKDIFVAYNTSGYSLASVVLEPYESNYCAVYDMTNAMASTDMEYENYHFSPPDVNMYMDYVYESIDWQGLTVSFDLYKETTNDMRVVAVLSDTNGQFVAQEGSWVSRTGYKTVELLFSREQINYSGYYGPFVLSLVQVLDGSDVVCGARNAYMTQAYTAEDFRYESAQPLSFKPQSFCRRYSGNADVADVDFSVESASASPLDFNVRLVVRGTDGSYAGSVSTNVTLAVGGNRLSAHIEKRDVDDSVAGPYHVSEIIFTPDKRLFYDCVRFFPNTVRFGFEGSSSDPSSVAKIGFAAPSEVVLEGDPAMICVFGGNADNASSVQLYLTYNTAAAADLDLAKGTIDGVTPKGGLKFPLTLSWAAGEIGEKVIAIPIKTDKAVEDDELFTLQLAAPAGMELGEERLCTVTIHDPGYDELAAKIAGGTATKAEQTAWDKLQKAKVPYVRGLAYPADGGKVTGSGLCAEGKKVTLKATANKNFAFLGWRRVEDNAPYQDGEYVATTASLVIDRTAKPAANSKTSTTITNVAEDVTYYAVFESYPEVFVTVDATDGDGSAPTGKGAGKYVAGTITGMGKYAIGKTKIALKATANKGYVFSGWCDANGELLTKDATYTIPSMGENDVEYTAKFITAEEDKGSITLAVDGVGIDAAVSSKPPYQTNVWAGVYLEWPVAADALSATTVKVAGLPSGLKFTAKPVTSKVGSGKSAVVVTNVPANTIYGAPTAASKADKYGNVKPSAVKVTVTTAGKSSQTYQIDTIVDPLPAWAVGTFAGGGRGAPALPGQVSLAIDAKGKTSGKALGDGLTYTLAAPYYSGFALDENQSSNFLADVTATWSYKDGSKAVKTNDVVQLIVQDNGIGGYAVAEDWFEAYTVNWKVEPWKTLGKKFGKKTITYAILSDGSFSEDEAVLASALGAHVTARVTLKFSANGSVSVAGEFVSGYNEKKAKYTTVKATGSATLVPVGDEHGEVLIYLTPKGLTPHARCMEVPWPEG